jgi:hypothetical protein
MAGGANPSGMSGPAGHAPLLAGRRPERAGPESRGAQVEGGLGGLDGLGPDRPADGLKMQETAGNGAVASWLGRAGPGDLVRSVVGRPGRPMDGAALDMVREATGQDASGIEVHEGEEAAAAARSVQAEMFASGRHIVAPKGLDVTTREGAFKTIHEVHHIVNQQAKGPVEGTETGDGLKISDPGDRHEREADEVAARAVRRRFDR